MTIPLSMSTEERIIEIKLIYRVVDTEFKNCRILLVRPWAFAVEKNAQLDSLRAEEMVSRSIRCACDG